MALELFFRDLDLCVPFSLLSTGSSFDALGVLLLLGASFSLFLSARAFGVSPLFRLSFFLRTRPCFEALDDLVLLLSSDFFFKIRSELPYEEASTRRRVRAFVPAMDAIKQEVTTRERVLMIFMFDLVENENYENVVWLN